MDFEALGFIFLICVLVFAFVYSGLRYLNGRDEASKSHLWVVGVSAVLLMMFGFICP